MFEPAKGWEAIATRDRSLAGVLFFSLIPGILLASVLEGIGLIKLGNSPSYLGLTNHHWLPVSTEMAVRYETGQAILSLMVVFLLAAAFQLILGSFHCRAKFRLSFTVMSYSYGPLLLMQALDGIPAIPTWICRGLGALLAVKVLYLGLGRVVRPDPSTALGLYFVGSLLIIALAGISHFLGLQILEGNLFNRWFS